MKEYCTYPKEHTEHEIEDSYHDHDRNRECIKDLIDALYNNDDELNIEFVAEQISSLADDYGVNFDRNIPLNIKKNKQNTGLFDFAFELAKQNTRLN